MSLAFSFALHLVLAISVEINEAKIHSVVAGLEKHTMLMFEEKPIGRGFSYVEDR